MRAVKRWICASCGWVNNSAGRCLCSKCRRPKGAPAENVAFVAEPRRDAVLPPSAACRKGKRWDGREPGTRKLRAEVATWPSGIPWC